MKRLWSGRKAALGFGLDQIETLVSMATGSSLKMLSQLPYGYNEGNVVATLVTSFLFGSSSFLQVMR